MIINSQEFCLRYVQRFLFAFNFQLSRVSPPLIRNKEDTFWNSFSLMWEAFYQRKPRAFPYLLRYFLSLRPTFRTKSITQNDCLRVSLPLKNDKSFGSLHLCFLRWLIKPSNVIRVDFVSACKIDKLSTFVMPSRARSHN